MAAPRCISQACRPAPAFRPAGNRGTAAVRVHRLSHRYSLTALRTPLGALPGPSLSPAHRGLVARPAVGAHSSSHQSLDACSSPDRRLQFLTVTAASQALMAMVVAAASAEDAQLEALGDGSDGSNIVTTVIFSLAILALLVVTLGVGYLSVMQFLDKRQQAQDLEAFEKKGSTSIVGDKSKIGKGNSKKGSGKVRQKVAARNGRGFSKKER